MLPAVAGVATGLHLEWAEHHRHTHHGPAAHHHPESHTRLDHDHHSHEPVEPMTLEALLRPAGPHGLNEATTDHLAVLSGVQADPALRTVGVLVDGAPPGRSSRDTLARHCTLLL